MSERRAEPLPFRVKQHKSCCCAPLVPDQMWLQHNKVTNLRLASAQVDTVLIRPGETFSFNKVIGNCTRRKGMSRGCGSPAARRDQGSAAASASWPTSSTGWCSTRRSPWWSAPSTPSTLPRQRAGPPLGVGCSIAYNYVDFVVRNDTDATYQLFVSVGERYLEGELRTDREPEHTFRVFAKDECFA